MRRQRTVAPAGLRLVALAGSGRGHTHGAPPFVEHVQHVGLAELHLDGPAARTFRVIALEAAIDAPAGHLDWNAARRPAADLLEHRADNANQMAVVLAAQIRLDLAAVFLGRL